MDELDSNNRARYYFEHIMFRDFFYGTDTGEKMIRALLNGGSAFLWDAVSGWCEETGNEIEGTKEQYRVFTCKCDKGYSMIRIDMPEPRVEPLCYQIYLVFSSDFQHRRYFTVERGASRKVRYLCSWEQGEFEVHCNYGRCSSNASKTEKRIVCIFANRKYRSFWRRQKIWRCALATFFIGSSCFVCREKMPKGVLLRKIEKKIKGIGKRQNKEMIHSG